MQIDEPPIATACSGCSSPLSWLFSARTQRWVAFVPDSSDARTLHVHGCRDGIPQHGWRDQHQVAGDPHRGAALARAAIRTPALASVHAEKLQAEGATA